MGQRLIISEQEYLHLPQLNSSKIRALYRFPIQQAKNIIFKKQNKENLLGKVIHSMILEPDHFKDQYDFIFNSNSQKTYLPEHTLQQAKLATELAISNSNFSKLLDHSEKELTIIWHEPKFNIDCKARIDMLCNDHLIDIKTISGAGKKKFSSIMKHMGYHIQMHWYHLALKSLQHPIQNISIFWIDLKNKRTSLQTLNHQDLLSGKQDCELQMEKYTNLNLNA